MGYPEVEATGQEGDERFRRRSHRVTEVRLSPQRRSDSRAAQPIFTKLLLSGAR